MSDIRVTVNPTNRTTVVGTSPFNVINNYSNGVQSLNGVTGAANISGQGNIFVSAQGQYVTVSGATGTLAAQSTLNASGQYLLGLIAGAGVVTINGLGGIVGITGANGITVYNSGNSLVISGANTGSFATSTNLASTGSNLLAQISTLNSWTGISTGLFVSPSQTGILASIGYVGSVSGILDTRLAATGSNLQGQINTHTTQISSLNNWSGQSTGIFYPYSANPSSYVTASQTGNFLVSGRVTYGKSMYLESPATGDRIPIFWTNNQLNLQRIKSVVYTTGGAASLTYQVTQSSSRTGVSGVVMAYVTETDQNAGTTYTSFANSVISGSGYAFFECSGFSNVNNISLTLEYQ